MAAKDANSSLLSSKAPQNAFQKNRSETFEMFVESAEPIRIHSINSQYWVTAGHTINVDCNIEIDLCVADKIGFDFPLEGPKRLISRDPNAPEALELARQWLQRCSQHSFCEAQNNTALPTRLIEVPNDPRLPLRIHTAKKDQLGKYVTLSHCWGKEQPFQTKSDNIQKLTEGFEVEILPPLFQDAVILTRALGLTYLWIDALCIIQDDPNDWALEAAAMTRVYYGALLMISATAAPDSSFGILNRRDFFRSHRFGIGNGLLWQSPSTSRHTSAMFTEQFIDRRAWTYQEKTMAKRILHFLDQEMVWGCSTCVYTETRGVTLSHDRSLHNPRAKRSLHKYMRPRRPNPNLGVPKQEPLRPRLALWYKCVQEYTYRDLTFAEDKLPALSGLSHGFYIPEFGNYLAGLWEVDLFRGLGWRYIYISTGAVREYECYVAPSWSYMSAQGKVHFYDVDDAPEPDDCDRFDSSVWERQYKPRLISHDIRPKTSDAHGIIMPGWILIRAYGRCVHMHQNPACGISRTCDARLWVDKREGFFPWIFDTGDGSQCLWDTFDNQTDTCGSETDVSGSEADEWLDGDCEVEVYTAVQIHRYRNNDGSCSSDKVIMLILTPTEGEHVYKRVGIASVTLKHEELYHENWQNRDFKIV
ncbi:heterokaryon incompatibility protein-domain-containing protein [Pestalotiopsis sp. NC0098]|nr:heterokaryon incompatibility protein-domain-containing protein [Pestalotiopsis sp. NC0098]